MGIIIDILIVLFILASIYLGYKKGLVSLAVHMVAFIITLVAVALLYRPIGNIVINNTNIDENLQTTIQEMVEKSITTENTDKVQNKLIESAKQGMLPEASKALATNIIYGTTMLILFIVVRIALIFVTALANLVAKLPILNQFNQLGGIVYGLLRGLIITYAVLMIINLAVSINPTGSLGTAIGDTHIAKSMINYNILQVFF